MRRKCRGNHRKGYEDKKIGGGYEEAKIIVAAFMNLRPIFHAQIQEVQMRGEGLYIFVRGGVIFVVNVKRDQLVIPFMVN